MSLLSTVGTSTGVKTHDSRSQGCQDLATSEDWTECARRCDDATDGCRLGDGRLDRAGGRTPTLAVLDWTGETDGRRIVSGVASV